MAKVNTKKSSAKARRQNKSTAERKLDGFELRHLRLRFLITMSIVNPNDIWADLNKGLFQEYLRLVDEQREALYDDGSQDDLERVVVFGTKRVRIVSADKSPLPLTSEMLEERVMIELNQEKSRTLADFEKVYGQKDEQKGQRQNTQQLPFIHDPPIDTPDFVNLDGSDDRVNELRDRVRDWLNNRHLGKNWCAETLINVMARQKEILERAHLRSIPQPYTDHWEIAWAKRFYTFIGDVEKSLAECGVKDVHLAPSLIKAWREEWMESANESFRTDLNTKPPSGYPRWLPDFENEVEYLNVIESAVKRELRNSPLLSRALGADWKKLVKRLLPEAKAYSRKLYEERKKQKGIEREKAKSEEVKHIVWAVLDQVIRMEREKIAIQSKSTQRAVQMAVGRILTAMKLTSWRKSGRKKGQKDIKSHRHIAGGSY